MTLCWALLGGNGRCVAGIMSSLEEKWLFGLLIGGASAAGFGMLIAWLFGGVASAVYSPAPLKDVFSVPLVIASTLLKSGSSSDFRLVRMDECGPGTGEGVRPRLAGLAVDRTFGSVRRGWDALFPMAAMAAKCPYRYIGVLM